jgi:hypothetical protein
LLSPPRPAIVEQPPAELPPEIRALADRAAGLFPLEVGLEGLVLAAIAACPVSGAGVEWVRLALEEAAGGKARGWGFVVRTLANWAALGRPTPRARAQSPTSPPVASPTPAERRVLEAGAVPLSADEHRDNARRVLAGDPAAPLLRLSLAMAGYEGDAALRILAGDPPRPDPDPRPAHEIRQGDRDPDRPDGESRRPGGTARPGRAPVLPGGGAR